ncbi:apolipoprotein D-like [Haemaphysalis longicornis]
MHLCLKRGVAFLLVVQAVTAKETERHCSDIPVVKNFQPSKFAGLWYDVARTLDPYSDTLKCGTTRYKTLGSTGLKVIKEAVDTSDSVVSLEAEAIFVDPSKCQGATVITEDDREGVYYNVVKTNYKEYAVVVACTLDRAPSSKWAWIQSRGPRLRRDTFHALRQLLKACGFSAEQLKSEDFGSCGPLHENRRNSSRLSSVVLF